MEYDKSKDGLIRASLADRVVELLDQYEGASVSTTVPRRDATLALVLLQFLLTNCFEALNKSGASSALRDAKDKPLTDVPDLFGLGRRMVKEFIPGENSPTFERVVKRLRNAVSHPLYPENIDYPRPVEKSGNPVTGFYQIVEKKQISAFGFIHSPEVSQHGKLRTVCMFGGGREEFDKRVKETRIRLKRDYPSIEIKEQESQSGDKLEFRLGDEIFRPVFRMEIPLGDLKKFVRSLGEVLAEPLRSASSDSKAEHQVEN